MANVFALLALVGRYPTLVNAVNTSLPELELAANEFSAWAKKHQRLVDDLPEVQTAYYELKAILGRHSAVLQQAQDLTPAVQAFIKELMPLISPPQMQPGSF